MLDFNKYKFRIQNLRIKSKDFGDKRIMHHGEDEILEGFLLTIQ